MSKPRFAFTAATVALAVLIPLSGCGSGGGTTSTPFPLPTAAATPIASPSPVPTASVSPSPTPTPTPTPNGPVTTGQYQNLVFTLSTPKRTYAVGETVPLVFTVQNTGTTDAAFSSTSPYFAACDVTDANGGYVSSFDNRTESRKTGKLTVINTLVVPAGQTKTFSLEWGAQSNNKVPFNQTAPGDYSIRGYVFAYALDGQPRNDADFGAAPLTITVQ